MIIDYLHTLIIISTVFIIISIKNYKNYNNIIILVSLYIYHILFIYIYYEMTFNYNADASTYYYSVYDNLEDYKFIIYSYSTDFIKNICYILIKYFELSYFNVFLIFGTLGYLGIWILYYLMDFNLCKGNYLLALLFLPSLHFWTSAIGKDSLMFFYLSLLLFALIKYKKFLIVLTVCLIFILRLHIAGMIIIAISFAIIFSIKSIKKKFIVIVLLSIILGPVVHYIFSYIGIELFNFDSIVKFIELRQNQNLNGGSSIDISNYNIFFKIITYLFRPFFEIFEYRYIVVSIENIIYLFIFCYIIVFSSYIPKNYLKVFTYVFIVIFILSMSTTISNLGIAVRQKTMLLPFLLYYFSLIYHRRKAVD